LRYVSGLGLTDRSTHGEALLRALEDQSESYLAHSTASAKGYYSNGEYSLGEVPSRWVYEMRQEEWVSSSERFGKLEDTYAKTEETVALIDPAVDLLCDWDCRSVEVAHALGFKTDVSATKVISDLRRAKSAETASNLVRFSAYYEYLGKTDIGQSEAKDAFGDGLIFAPSRRQRWCRPEECLQKDQTSVFGEFCGYLNMYEEALPLWESLEVMATPDMEFLIRFWNRTAAEVKSQVEGMQRVLRNTYDLAEKLLEGSNIARQPIQVVAGEDWREGSLVFATSSDEIAEQLTSHGLLRWDYQFPERVPRFLRWAGIPYVERDADIQVVPSNVVADTDLERKLHVGVQVFATEIDRQAPDILPAIRSRIRDILHGKVKRLDGLTVQISLNIASGDNIDCTVAVSAFYKEGNVFISGSTAISDESLATELLKGLNLSGHQQTSAINILRLQLMSDHSDADLEPLDLLDEEDLPDLGVEYLDTPPSTDREDPLDDDPIEPEGGEFGRKRRSEPVVHPTDGFQVASDIGGENSDQHEGGLQSSPETKLREPSPKGRHDRGGSGPDKHSRRDTEQRAVDLFRQYVLEPEGIDISDQTLVSRVGADLSCSDGVFRELKSYSESGGGRVKLTSHEYVRAEHAQMAYELVIVEHVWGNEPSITIIPNPLARLKYWPVGDIAAEGWNQMNPPPRVVRLEII